VFRQHEGRSTPIKRRRSAGPRERISGEDRRSNGDTGQLPGGGDAQIQLIVDALDDLRDTVVREVMTPRMDVVALSIPVTADAVTRAIRESGHSCFPVYDDNLDDLIGVLFVNDLFRAGWTVRHGRFESQGGDTTPTGDSAPGSATPERIPIAASKLQTTPDPVDISRRLRQPFLVPESRLVLDVLAEMRRQRRAFAVVVDEHGGVEGVLTVKDLLGALVGHLPDEFDTDDEPDVVRVDGNRWLVDGRMSVDDVRDRLGIDLPDGEYVTLGGFLFDGFGHIPAEGETYPIDGWELLVTEMDKRRVAKVVACQRTPERPEAGPDVSAHAPGSDRSAVG
jgi:magnesium and cobalt transporter